ncbi:hypothetical protein HGI81_02685 [Olsenella sp. KGMB02461]|nr:hypothetical protein [Olsenella sp. KGMB02461]
MIRRLFSALFRVVAYLARIAAILLSGLVVILCLGTATNLGVVGVIMTLNGMVPSAISGMLVIPTPLGGAFRGDFALLAIALFVVDWAAMRIASALR